MKKINLNEAIILFGSFAKFSANKDSDLDMLVISNAGQVTLPMHLLPYKLHEINMSEVTFMKSIEKQDALVVLFIFSSRRRHTRYWRDWS